MSQEKMANEPEESVTLPEEVTDFYIIIVISKSKCRIITRMYETFNYDEHLILCDVFNKRNEHYVTDKIRIPNKYLKNETATIATPQTLHY